MRHCFVINSTTQILYAMLGRHPDLQRIFREYPELAQDEKVKSILLMLYHANLLTLYGHCSEFERRLVNVLRRVLPNPEYLAIVHAILQLFEFYGVLTPSTLTKISIMFETGVITDEIRNVTGLHFVLVTLQKADLLLDQKSMRECLDVIFNESWPMLGGFYEISQYAAFFELNINKSEWRILFYIAKNIEFYTESLLKCIFVSFLDAIRMSARLREFDCMKQSIQKLSEPLADQGEISRAMCEWYSSLYDFTHFHFEESTRLKMVEKRRVVLAVCDLNIPITMLYGELHALSDIEQDNLLNAIDDYNIALLRVFFKKEMQIVDGVSFLFNAECLHRLSQIHQRTLKLGIAADSCFIDLLKKTLTNCFDAANTEDAFTLCRQRVIEKLDHFLRVKLNKFGLFTKKPTERMLLTRHVDHVERLVRLGISVTSLVEYFEDVEFFLEDKNSISFLEYLGKIYPTTVLKQMIRLFPAEISIIGDKLKHVDKIFQLSSPVILQLMHFDERRECVPDEELEYLLQNFYERLDRYEFLFVSSTVREEIIKNPSKARIIFSSGLSLFAFQKCRESLQLRLLSLDDEGALKTAGLVKGYLEKSQSTVSLFFLNRQMQISQLTDLSATDSSFDESLLN